MNNQPGPQTKSRVTRITDDPALLEQERVTFGKKNISTDHANIHEGIAFSYATKQTIANGTSYILEVLAPANGYVHFKPVSIQSDGPKILLQMIEAPTATPGSAVTPINRRRVGTPPVAATVLRSGPSGVSGGTVIDQDYIGGGSSNGGQTSSGGNASNDNEWVLKPGALYHLKVTNGGSSPADVLLKVFFYEEIDG